ncbi:class I SAM-dependent methyltransferase [Inquilinus sp. CAU 1745]|uniref:class I SAM-dependent methyltransferase n=1 Tax=Inquilinus sp. CAU 1745 TaxID=3140369 RepID=UPI00325AC390
MSGFDESWLTLREPYDHRARSGPVEDAVKGWAAGRPMVRVLDLGGGTGSNLRRLAPALPMPQRWTILDHDEALLAAIPARLSRWAADRDATLSGGRIAGGGLDIEVAALRCDLTGDLPLAGHDLVTGSALLDLVSAGWADRLMDSVGQAQFWTLNVDGRVEWSPGDPDDDQVMELVRRHQCGDKGFGPALGGQAIDHMEAGLRKRGATVTTGQSDWVLGPGDEAIQRALLVGYADAATAVESDEAVERWRKRRLSWIEAGRSGLIVGHCDLFAC